MIKKYLRKFNNYEPLTILCIGDSTTSQEWVHPNWTDWLNFTFRQSDNWPYGCNRKLINNGRDGGTIYDYTNHFEQEVNRFKPDVVIVSLGFNHLELAKSPTVLKKDLDKLFTLVKYLPAELITWSTYDVPHSLHSNSLAVVNDVYQELTQKHNGIFIDMYHEFKQYDARKIFTYQSPEGNEVWHIKPGEIDYLHCNEIGNQIIAQKIARDAFNVPLLQWPTFGTMQLHDLHKYLRNSD